MSAERDPSESADQHVQPYSERLRKALAHDLRSPLGTIVNYASILEFHESADREEVRALAARIRLSASRLAVMMQHMADATALATRPVRIVEVDLSAVLRGLLFDLGLQGRYPAKGAEPSGTVIFDLDLLTFVWRAFLSIHAEGPRVTELDLDIEVKSDRETMAIELWVGQRPGTPQERSGFTQFAHGLSDQGPSEACMAMGFAEALLHERGGKLELWGRPGDTSGLFLGLPIAS